MQILVTLGVTIAMAGCQPVQSVSPFFEAKEVIFEPQIVGDWRSANDGNLDFLLAAANSNGYTVKWRVQDDSGGEEEFTFQGHLFKVHGVTYLDLLPEQFRAKPSNGEFEGRAGTDEGLFMAATHTVYRVWLDKDQLTLAYLNDESVSKFVHANHLQVSAESPDLFLLTGSTQELQSQILANAEEEDLLGGDMEFARQESHR